MVVWRISLLIVVASLACITALPTREGADKEPDDKEKRLLFEAHNETEVKDNKNSDHKQEGVPTENHENQDAAKKGENDALFQKAMDEKVARKAHASKEEIGALSGHDRAHGGEKHVHEHEAEMLPMKHVNKGALDDDFVHNMMHDGDGDHEKEDAHIRKKKPVEMKDVSKMGFSKDDLKQFKDDAFKHPDAGQPTYKDQQHGPNRPDKELHGVLMHGDTAVGKKHDHEHENMHKQDKEAGVVPEPPNTKTAEELVHGEGTGHVHDKKPHKQIKGSNSPDSVLDDHFMHNLMHGGLEKHDHDDSQLKKAKVIRPRDLLNLGLDASLLKGLDLKKMIQDDMEEYNKFMSEKGGDENSVWNILNSFQFRYFKNHRDIEDISTRGPKEAEWDESVVARNKADAKSANKDLDHGVKRKSSRQNKKSRKHK